jgi:AcrR family transcriptional regulator
MNVTVADIIRHAKISRPTFYELFANKEECIEAAYGTSLASLQEKEWKRRFGPPVTRGRSETSGSGDSSKPSPTELTPLPPGRHGLPREVVQRNQRERMIAAAAKAVAERGYVGTTVRDITRRARVSKRTFYEHFANKEECFVAARELLAEQKQDQGAAAIQSATDDTSNPSGLAHRQKELISHYQRERLIAGAAKAVEERGLMNVTVADIIRNAKVSRRTFYDHFAGKEKCIEAAYGTSLIPEGEEPN